MGKINVEAEKNELILENEFGDKVIIPAKKRQWVQKQIEKGNHADLDNYISTLPIKSDFAEEGSVVPGDPTKKVKVYTGKPEYFVQGVAPRNGERKNEDGSVSTHLMSYTSADGVHYAYPTLFQDGDKWIQLDDKDDWAAFKEAQKRKELFKFDNEEDAKKFAEGSWKTENIKEYDIDSPEYRELYNSGAIANYDKNSDTYILSKPLDEVVITAEAPQWMKYKRDLEEQYTKDWYIDNKMPKFSRSMGVSADNMHSNSVKQYNEFINNKLAEKLLKRNPNFEKEYESHLNSGRIDYLSSQFSPKELAIIKDSSSKNKISPSFLSSLEQNLLSIGNVNPVMKLKNSNLTNEEAQKEDTPFGLLERTGELGANAVRSVFDKDYTVKQFLSGKQSDATTAEKIAFDVLNLVGAGAWGKLSKTAKLAKLEEGYQAIKAGSKVLNKTDDVIKTLPKLEQIPLDFKIEDVLKNISTIERKNMEIVKKGNAYFKELDNPESLKRLKEFGDEYDIDLLDAYKKAEQRWDYGNNIGKNDRFQVKKTDEDWYGLSTTKWDYEDELKLFELKQTFGEDSEKVKDFYKTISQEKSINYISDVVPLNRYEKTIWHELSHDINKSIIDQSPKLQQDIKNIFIEKGTADINQVRKAREYVADDFYTKRDKVLKDLDNPEKLKEISEEEFDYITRPTETWAFLSTNLRQDLKNTGVIKNYNELLTPEKLEQAIKNGNTVFSRFEPYIKDKEAFIKLFNKMTLSIAPAALYLQSQQNNNEGKKP